jgi:hypothetical protein
VRPDADEITSSKCVPRHISRTWVLEGISYLRGLLVMVISSNCGIVILFIASYHFENDHIYLQLKADGLGLVVVEAELTSR